jgi:poly(A) polymerase
LLSSVSPSRLTEEIFKIIHSPQAANIVEALDAMGLYARLQPRAAELMKKDLHFRSNYLKGMAALNQEGRKNLPGEALGALINDHLEDIADWEQGAIENYKACYAAARRFILPMNPPRFELDFAVRHFFAAHGISVKRPSRQNPVRETEIAAATTTATAAHRRHGKVHSP